MQKDSKKMNCKRLLWVMNTAIQAGELSCYGQDKWKPRWYGHDRLDPTRTQKRENYHNCVLLWIIYLFRLNKYA